MGATAKPTKQTRPATLGHAPLFPHSGLWKEPSPKPVVRHLLGGAAVPVDGEALGYLRIGLPVQRGLLPPRLRLDLLHPEPRLGHDLRVRMGPTPLLERSLVAPSALRHVSRLVASGSDWASRAGAVRRLRGERLPKYRGSCEPSVEAFWMRVPTVLKGAWPRPRKSNYLDLVLDGPFPDARASDVQARPVSTSMSEQGRPHFASALKACSPCPSFCPHVIRP